MVEALIVIWIIIGATSAMLAAQEARREGISVAWGWWVLFVVLGPIVPLLVAIAALLRLEMGQKEG